MISNALREKEGVENKGMGVDVPPLVELLGQGDVAAAAACSILTGVALERPLVVIPEVGGLVFVFAGWLVGWLAYCVR